MTVHYSNNIAYLTSDLLESFKLNHGFFMRHGGCSPKPWRSLNMATSVGDSRENVIENRSRIAFSMKINRSSYYDLWQVHSNKVVIADQPRPINEAHLKADAIVTNRKGVSLLMLFADCVPVLLFDPNTKCHRYSPCRLEGYFEWGGFRNCKSYDRKISLYP